MLYQAKIIPSMELAITTRHFSAGITRLLLVGLAQPHIDFFLASRHGLLKQLQLSNQHTCTQWKPCTGEGQKGLGSESQGHPNSQPVCSCSPLSAKCSPSQSQSVKVSHRHLKACTADGWSRARPLLGHESTWPAGNGITLGAKH